MHNGKYLFEATIFRNSTVTISLLVFVIALCRITRVVRKIRGAFPNRGRTYLHFLLVLVILSCNLGFLSYTFIYFFHDKSDSCDEDMQKFFYALDLLSFAWDLFEFALQILMLLIVLKYTAVSGDGSESKADSHARSH